MVSLGRSQVLSVHSLIDNLMVRRPSPAVYLSADLDAFLKRLDPQSKFKKWLIDMEKVLKENMYSGELIKKNQIPPDYIKRYGVNNLYRYAHHEGYRSCYTILNVKGVGVCPFVLDLLSHEQYDKIFHYRKR